MTGEITNEYRAYAKIVADDAEWLPPGTTLPAPDEMRWSDLMPEPGSQHLVRVAQSAKPFVLGMERWLLFDAASDGWINEPEALLASAFVRARLRWVERTDKQYPDDNWLRFDVLEVLHIEHIEQRFPPQPRPSLDGWRFPTAMLMRFADWQLLYAPLGEAGYWLLARTRDDGAHIVAAGEWRSGVTAAAWAGHLVLPHEAWRYICRGA